MLADPGRCSKRPRGSSVCRSSAIPAAKYFYVDESQMETALRKVAKREKFDLPDEAAARIIQDSAGNMRKAILVLEAMKMQSYVIFSSPPVAVE